MKALIAGAGIGGLTTALAFNAAGIEVEIFERTKRMEEVGAGIQISPNAVRVLQALGLGETLARVAFRPDAVEYRLYRSGLRVSISPLADTVVHRYGAPYYNIHRADLHSMLMQAVQERCGDSVRLSQSVIDVEQSSNEARLVLADGSKPSADVVIGCDGIHSAVRAASIGPEKPEFTGHVAWRGIAPTERLTHAGLPPVVTVWMAPNSHVVTYYVRNASLVNFVGVIEHAGWVNESWFERGEKAELLRHFGHWHPSVRAVAEAIDQPFRWALLTRKPLPKWSDRRITLVGDACHPMLPYLAQAAAMSIEDAYVLAGCLRTGSNDIPAALQRYQGLRLERTTKVQEGARENGHLFHLVNPLVRMKAYGKMGFDSRFRPEEAARRNDWLMSYDVADACPWQPPAAA